MDEIVLLTSLAMFLLLAAVCSIIFNKIKLPPLIGYLMTGIIIVNFWHTDEIGEAVVDILSNMGLIILMFCIGLEINLKKIRKQGLFAIEVALVQLPLMIMGGIIVGGFMGLNSIQSICLGAIISGSSTAVVLAVMNTHNLLDADHKATLILVLIMEDIGQVIVLSIITPLMAGSAMDPGGLMAMIVSIIAFMIVSIFAGLRLMPRVINWISDNVSSEVLVITCVGLAFGMALLANYAGLSVAIGAFLMGMMIASSRKSKEVAHDIEPMKNIFMAMFFISVGMEVELNMLVENFTTMITIYLLFAGLIITSVFIGYWMGNENPRTGFISAISLTVMGEFAFIIAKQALDYQVVDTSFYTSVVGAALLSMVILPIVARNSGKIWDGAAARCPHRLMVAFQNINNRRAGLYGRIDASSKKTRKEFDTIIAHIYALIVVCTVIEIAFMLITQIAIDWGNTYFGGDKFIWRFVILAVNLLVLYIPMYRLFYKFKAAISLGFSDSYRRSKVISDSIPSNVSYAFLKTDTSLLSLMISISIIIVVPNGLGLGEHLVILAAALVILFLYNRKHLRAKRRLDLYPKNVDDSEESIDTESFIKMIQDKVEKIESSEKEEKEKDTHMVSIDTRNFDR